MSDPYERVKGGRLTFKGGALASRSKSIDKKNKKSKKKHPDKSSEDAAAEEIYSGEAAAALGAEETEGSPTGTGTAPTGGEGDIYTIDAAKRRKYDELFPVEAKKFGYDPKAKVKSVEDALDDRVKKKADRYCK